MLTNAITKKMLAILLTAIIMFGVVCQSFAVSSGIDTESASKIVKEVTSLREENVKYFLCEDGSYVAATYATPVHFEANGIWKDIDNTLVLNKGNGKSNEAFFSPVSSKINVKLPSRYGNDQKITAENNGFYISFGLVNDETDQQLVDAIGEAVDPSELTSSRLNETTNKDHLDEASVKQYNEEKLALHKTEGALIYSNVSNGTDIEYVVSPTALKENIVISSPQDDYSYRFSVELGELIPIKEDDGSIGLYSAGDKNNAVFSFEAPYMFDALNSDSHSVDMSIEQNGDNYIMTVEADAEWINDPSRVFPVVIDPTLNYYEAAFDDMYVIDGLGAGSQWRNKELRVGRNLTNLARTYVKLDLPANIPSAGLITSASLTFKQRSYYRYPSDSMVNIRVYDCDHTNQSFSSIDWNHQPFNTANNGYTGSNATLVDQQAAGSDENSYTFNITTALTRWYNDINSSGATVNHYLMFASSNESSRTQIDLCSTRISSQVKRPIMTVAYSLVTVTLSGLNTNVKDWSTSDSPASKSVTVTPSNLTAATVDPSSQSWLSVSSVSSGGFIINVASNTSAYGRTGHIQLTFSAVNNYVTTINVIQMGTAPTLIVDNDNCFSYSTGGTIDVDLYSNAEWSITSISPVADSQFSVSPLSGTGDGTIHITLQPNSTLQAVVHTITVSTIVPEANNAVQTINVTQLDKASDLFNHIVDDSANARTAVEYNHPLASFAMYASYAAYNPLVGLSAQLIPGFFIEQSMSDITASDVLQEYGFSTAQILTSSYECSNKSAEYVFGYRQICFAGQTRGLAVAIIRGTVTGVDWWTDIKAEFSHGAAFKDQADYIKSLLENFITSNYSASDGDPLILITGHSLGAAVANLMSAEFNEDIVNTTQGAQNYNDRLYSYTFATPYALDGSISSNVPAAYANQFNILNTNDAVTFVPTELSVLQASLSGTIETDWFRYGHDHWITMPMDVERLSCIDTAVLGLSGHAMSTYRSWLENLPTQLNKSAEEITLDDLNYLSVQNVAYGAFPKLFKVKCPVEVTIEDDDGNILAYESSEPNAVYPQIQSGSDIVSWITGSNEKIFCVPYGHDDVTARVMAYDYGAMNFTVATLGADGFLEEKTFNNVSLYPDKEFVSEVSQSVSISDVQLFHVTGSNSYEEITDLDPLLKSAVPQYSTLNYGSPQVITVVTDKTVTKVQFIDSETNATLTYDADNVAVISLVTNGDLKTWVIQRNFRQGDLVFHVKLKVGYDWQPTTYRVFGFTVI